MNKIFKIVGIVLLLIVTFIVFGNWTSLKPFDLDEAISNGTLINMHGFITNLDSLDNFVKDIENRKDSEIEIVHYTIEGDPIIHILKYENNVIHSTLDPRHDQFGNSDVIKEEYDSIEVKEVHRNETIYKQYKLTSDNEESIFFTYELGIEETHVNEIEGSYFSAESDITGLVELLKINDEVWVHRTYYDYNGKKVSSNGLVIISSDMLVMVDTPWTNEQTETLITLAEEHFARAFSLAFVTHAHMDRMGGIDTLLDKGINVQSSELTIVEAEKNGFAKPEFMLNENMYMPIRGKAFEFYYPGEGHAKDNMVLWLPDSKILYGACLVKSLKSKTLGSLADANIEAWPQSLVNLKERYPDADIVIPGHGQWGGVELIDHTQKLLSEHVFTENSDKDIITELVIKAINDTAFSEKFVFECTHDELKFSGTHVKEKNYDSDFKLSIYLDEPVQCMEDVMIDSWGRGYTDFEEDFSFSAGAHTQRDMKGIGPTLTDLPITQINRFGITKDRREAIDEIVRLENIQENTMSYLITFSEDSEWSSQELYVEINMINRLLNKIIVNDESDYYGDSNYTLFIDQVELSR